MMRAVSQQRRYATTAFMKKSKIRAFSIAAAAAAFSTSTNAWLLNPPTAACGRRGLQRHSSTPIPLQLAIPHAPTTTRLYQSSPLRQRDSNNNDNNDSDGLFGKLGKAAKSMLPTNLFGSEEEKEKLARKQEVKDQVKGSMDEMLKNAPLGVRMMGKMVAPLMGNLASTMAEGFSEQQRATEGLLDDARELILSDAAVTQVMGTPIQIGAPFSQSSSMSSVNGKAQSRIELALNISGPKRSGIARILATEDGISQLLVESGGQLFDVNLASRGRRSGGSVPKSFGGGGGDENIIEAEIIDKDTSNR
ncbi:MAG: hypothetical protein SGILL_002347 [Bacillariaceae sp.]